MTNLCRSLRSIGLVAIVLLIGCGGGAGSTIGISDGGSADLIQLVDGSTSDGAVGCDNHPCATNQLCDPQYTGFCGGALPPCEPLPDGGVCPFATELDTSCYFASGDTGPGCRSTCVLVGHTCIDIPSGCASAPTCDCLIQAMSIDCCSITDGTIAGCPKP